MNDTTPEIIGKLLIYLHKTEYHLHSNVELGEAQKLFIRLAVSAFLQITL